MAVEVLYRSLVVKAARRLGLERWPMNARAGNSVRSISSMKGELRCATGS
jgi:hypothetical protein